LREESEDIFLEEESVDDDNEFMSFEEGHHDVEDQSEDQSEVHSGVQIVPGNDHQPPHT